MLRLRRRLRHAPGLEDVLRSLLSLRPDERPTMRTLLGAPAFAPLLIASPVDETAEPELADADVRYYDAFSCPEADLVDV
jgi:hypothetical protein